MPKDWACFPLRRVLNTRSGNLLPADIHKSEQPGDIVVYGSTEIIGYTASPPNLKKDSLTLARVGQYAGKVSFAKSPAWVSDNALIIALNNALVSVDYAALLLSAMNLNDHATKTAQPLLTGSTVRAQVAPLPPISAQATIVNFVKDQDKYFDLLKQKAKEAIALLREHRASLISAAVTGQINVHSYRAANHLAEAVV